jgi:predicted transcriptional regulator
MYFYLILQKDNLKGKLSEKMNDKNSKMTERDLLKYLKQLVWITYALHEDYNIIHRNLTP